MKLFKDWFYLVKAANANKGVICIEDNKMDIYNTFVEKTKSLENISIALFKEKYPQGAEKQMIYALTKKRSTLWWLAN